MIFVRNWNERYKIIKRRKLISISFDWRGLWWWMQTVAGNGWYLRVVTTPGRGDLSTTVALSETHQHRRVLHSGWSNMLHLGEMNDKNPVSMHKLWLHTCRIFKGPIFYVLIHPNYNYNNKKSFTCNLLVDGGVFKFSCVAITYL